MSDVPDDSRQTNIPALGETELDDADATTGRDVDEDTSSSDQSAPYQDDLDYKDTDVDPIANEETYSPAEELQIPEGEFKRELDKYVDDDLGRGDDDMRETIEDRDEADDNSAASGQ